MLRHMLVRIVVLCARARWLVVAIALAATAYSSLYVARNFAIDTNINHLISPDLPWRQNQAAYLKAFPGEATTILAVIDAPTAELAQSAADQLTEKLRHGQTWIRGVNEANGSPFFRQNGLLYLSEPDLNATLKQILRSGPFFGRLAADPSLRGVTDSIGLSLRGVALRRVSFDSLAPEFRKLSGTIDDVLQGDPAHFSWMSQLESGGTKPATRQLVTISPVLDFSALQPGLEATTAIRRAVDELRLKEQGVKVRLTGQMAISDDEFDTLRQGAALNAALTVAAVLFILWLALHSFRIILATFLSVAAGLAATAAAGLSLVGALNPISIAFFVLFVGIGVDFCLQFSVSYRAARYEHPNFMRALAETAANNGGRLVLAALATAAGFLSFLPTAYLGVSELGEIAGIGMIVALILSLTLLPALLRILNPPPEPSPLGYAFLVPLDRFMERHRRVIVGATVALVLAASPLLFWLQFDINPMNLRNPNVESVAAYLDVGKDPQTSGQTAEILAPSLADADRMAKSVQALPEVGRVMTLSSFIPEDQAKKLATIKETADNLRDQLHPANVKPKPTDAEVVSSLEATAASLSGLASDRQGQGAQAARDLSSALTRLAKASPEMRARATAVFIPPLDTTLENLRMSLSPERITLKSIPPDLASQWVTTDGKARVSISPKGDASSTASLRRFVDAVLTVEPKATGATVGVVKAGDTVIRAFIEAAIWALASIALLLWLFLRKPVHVALTLFPLILAAVVTLEICSAIGFKLNFANIIALPVLLGLGVAFKIYYIVAWRQGQTDLLASPLTRAIFFSGLTTAVAFGSLWMSNHPGTSSMGQLLALSLACTMAFAILFQPLLMGPPEKKVTKAAEPEAESPRPDAVPNAPAEAERT